MSSHRDEGVTGAPEREPGRETEAPPRSTPGPGTSDGAGSATGGTARAETARSGADSRADRPGNMLPGRSRRRFGIERLLVRLVATCGIIAIGVALGAILVSSKVQGWITGLVVAVVSVVLAGMLWSSRQL